MLDQLKLDDFTQLVDQDQRFRAADGEFVLRLSEASPLNQPTLRAQPAFRLLYASTERKRLPQGNFELSHPTHGPLVVFMVPVAPDARGSLFEVIFN